MERKVKDNHPGKGSITTVEPIRDTKDIQAIKTLLSENLRNLAYFTLGVNSGIRAGDLLQLKVGQVRLLKVGETLAIREQKTKKMNGIVINKAVHRVLKQYLDTENLADNDWLFMSQKGNSPLTVAAINHLIKSWTKSINLQGNYGAHSTRKTWAYHQRTKYGVSWELICNRLRHSSPAITMRYLGIQSQEITNILLNEI